MITSDLFWQVAELLKNAPRPVREAWEKAPGEWVTDADLEIEEMLRVGLAALVPGQIIGEEGGSTYQGTAGGSIWVVDPVDGTANLASGRSEVATMVALVSADQVVGAWILDWRDSRVHGFCMEERHLPGALDVGQRLTARSGKMHGVFSTRFFTDRQGARLRSALETQFDLSDPSGSAGIDYLDLIWGKHDFLLYERTLVWDHLAGVGIWRQLGGVASFGDGTDYGIAEKSGLAVATSVDVVEKLLRARLDALG
jgi:fructose-1,6-bisphosphatase/inositol monophosphatase family enzyme